MKGVGPVVIALIVMIIVIFIEALVLSTFIGGTSYYSSALYAIKVVEGVHTLENVKLNLRYSLYYSYREALKRKGFNNFDEIMQRSNYEEIIEELEEETNNILKEYIREMNREMGVEIPYGKVEITPVSNLISIEYDSPEKYFYYKFSASSLRFTLKDICYTRIRVSKFDNSLLSADVVF